MAEKKEKNLDTLLGSQALGMLASSVRDGSFRELWRDWKWIFRYSRRFGSRICLYTLVGVLASLMATVSAIAGKYLIDIITGADSRELWAAAAALVLGTGLGILLGALNSRISARLSLDINNLIQAEVFEKLLDSDWMELNRYQSGDLLNRCTSDVSAVAGNAVGWLPNIVTYGVSFLVSLGVMLYYDPVMAIIALASAPVLLLSSRYLLKRMRGYNEKMKAVSDDVMGFEVETLGSLDTVKSFGIEGKTVGLLRDWQRAYREISLEYNMFAVRTNAWLSVVGALVQFATFAYCLWRLWTGGMLFGTMTLFMQQRASLSSAFSGLVGQIPAALTGAVSAQRIREITELEKERHSSSALPELQGGCSVKLNDVDFAYREGEYVVKSAEFYAAPGEIVAIVGPSGEGKTTMLRLMLGLVGPETGHAELTDGAGRRLELNADTRRLFSYVPQGNTVGSGTIAENLRLVRGDATDEQIEAALKTACAWDFVSKLEGGVNAFVGERGRGLSEGQAQRIAIARAVLRDAPVMLLDEATSALDVATERELLRRLADSRAGRTCIITTHRPSVLDLCTRVYRVQDGRVTLLGREESRRLVEDF